MDSNNNNTILDQLIEYHDKIQRAWIQFYGAVNDADNKLREKVPGALPPMGQLGQGDKNNADSDVPGEQEPV